MKDYRERVRKEYLDLGAKIDRLRAFCSVVGGVFDGLPDDEKGRLIEQLGHMEAYLDVLRRRIKAFE